jgi:hypothetical protein
MGHQVQQRLCLQQLSSEVQPQHHALVLLVLQDPAAAGAAAAGGAAHRGVAVDSPCCCPLPGQVVHCCLHLPQHRACWHDAARLLLLAVMSW